MKKIIVITTIFPPTKAVKKFANSANWQLIVVGDKKTPAEWKYRNVNFISAENDSLGISLAKHLPFNSYSRKNIGYINAIKSDAEIIYDTDDDNIPYENWDDVLFDGQWDTLTNKGFVNIYKYFTKEFIWPRGFPLNKILNEKEQRLIKKNNKIGVWQFLADDDSDVDAIYRLTIGKNIKFNKRAPIILDKNTISPINSQNTFFRKEVFPLLYLPSYVSFRFSDILRGYILQPILWTKGYRVGFGSPTVYQKRNPHNYINDFEAEIPFYLNNENIISELVKVTSTKYSIEENMIKSYERLIELNIVKQRELKLLNLWFKDINSS